VQMLPCRSFSRDMLDYCPTVLEMKGVLSDGLALAGLRSMNEAKEYQ
jgi:hypothetical protein